MQFGRTGFCGRGVFQSTAIGIVMAELILDNKCRYGVELLHADRFDDALNLDDREEIKAQCYRRYSNHYGS